MKCIRILHLSVAVFMSVWQTLYSVHKYTVKLLLICHYMYRYALAATMVTMVVAATTAVTATMVTMVTNYYYWDNYCLIL